MFEIPRGHWTDFAPQVFCVGAAPPFALPIFFPVGALLFFTQTTFLRDLIIFKYILKWVFCNYLTQDQLMEHDMIQ